MSLSGPPNQPTAYDFTGQMDLPESGAQMIGKKTSTRYTSSSLGGTLRQ